MTAALLADGPINYHPCRYGSSKLLFRGPPKRVRGQYLAFLGGAETFGQFIERPFPELVGEALGIPAINLGCPGAGVDAFNSSPSLIDICSLSQATVIQILGAANMSNRFYTVDPRNNRRFVRASRKFKDIYPEVDFGRFEDTYEMLGHVARVGPDRLHLVRQEVQSAWVARMRTLLGQIDGPKVLLWLSDHPPFTAARGGTICREPLFIDRAMLNAVRDHADALVEVIGSAAEVAAGFERMFFAESEEETARTILGPVVHERVADQLRQVLRPWVATSEAAMLGSEITFGSCRLQHA